MSSRSIYPSIYLSIIYRNNTPDQWFLNGANFAPSPHLSSQGNVAMSRDIFGCPNWEEVLLASRG